MDNRKRLAAALGAALAASAPQASAVSFGFGYAHNSGDAEADNSGGTDFDFESSQYGFVLDTGSAERVFQYRLALDYIDGDLERGPAKGSYDGFAITNHFGFRINRADSTNVWIGPSLHIANTEFELGGSEEDAVLVAVGPTVGVNIGLQGGATVALELGYRSGTYEVDNSGVFGDFDTDDFQFRASFLFGGGK